MSLIKLQGNASGTGAFTIAAPNGNTDRTLTLPDNTGTILTSASTSVLPKGGPAFSVYYTGAGQSLTQNGWTKITLNTEEYDTASCFDATTNYRFTPTVAGHYQFSGNVELTTPGSIACTLYKNGSEFKRGVNLTSGSATAYTSGTGLSSLIYLNGTTDYVEMYAYVNNSGASTASTAVYRNYLTGFLARAD